MQAKHLHLPVPERELLSETCTDKRHPLDVTGHHLFVCVSHRTIPRDNMRDRFRAFCASAGLKAVCEPTNCLAIHAAGAATQDRPDIAVSNLDNLWRTLLLDVTTTDAGCFSNVDTHRTYESRARVRARVRARALPFPYRNAFLSSESSSRDRRMI